MIYNLANKKIITSKEKNNCSYCKQFNKRRKQRNAWNKHFYHHYISFNKTYSSSSVNSLLICIKTTETIEVVYYNAIENIIFIFHAHPSV